MCPPVIYKAIATDADEVAVVSGEVAWLELQWGPLFEDPTSSMVQMSQQLPAEGTQWSWWRTSFGFQRAPTLQKLGDEGTFGTQALMASCTLGHNPVSCGKVVECGALARH